MERALVTGASRGIGRALAIELAKRGYEVVATARRVADLDDLPAAARLPLDVTSDASVAAVAAEAGQVDLLINNAGVSVSAPVEDIPAEVALALFDTNVVGPLRLISAFVPGMRERGGGTVVNVSSVGGQAVFPLNGPNSATKYALEALSEALALEAGPHRVRVLIVQVGSVATGMFEHQQRYASPAYEDMDRTNVQGFDEHRAHQASPEQTAAAIVDAIADRDSPLRVPIGQDAARLLGERARLDDTGWLARVREMSGGRDDD
jgi:NAD(P)-dependent dehydrogenase (short-subunit alcohol dehydrogenase family)